MNLKSNLTNQDSPKKRINNYENSQENHSPRIIRRKFCTEEELDQHTKIKNGQNMDNYEFKNEIYNMIQDAPKEIKMMRTKRDT